MLEGCGAKGFKSGGNITSCEPRRAREKGKKWTLQTKMSAYNRRVENTLGREGVKAHKDSPPLQQPEKAFGEWMELWQREGI